MLTEGTDAGQPANLDHRIGFLRFIVMRACPTPLGKKLRCLAGFRSIRPSGYTLATPRSGHVVEEAVEPAADPRHRLRELSPHRSGSTLCATATATSY